MYGKFHLLENAYANSTMLARLLALKPNSNSAPNLADAVRETPPTEGHDDHRVPSLFGLKEGPDEIRRELQHERRSSALKGHEV